MKKLIVISAPSGAGKTSIVHYLLKNREDISFSISACSRKKRENEIHSKDYYFLGVDEFKNKIKEDAFLEWEEVYTNHFYGSLKASSEQILSSGKNILFDVDVKGALSIKSHFKTRAYTIYIQPPSIEIAKKRLIARKTESQKNLDHRIKKMEKEALYGVHMDCSVINDDLELAKIEIYNSVKDFLIK